MAVFTVICLALLIDRLFGEPRRYHPLMAFGRLASALEARLNRRCTDPAWLTQTKGALALLALTLLPAVVCQQLLQSEFVDPWLSASGQILGLYFCIGRQSLVEHARAVATPLRRGDLDAARGRVALIVSRDSAAMNESEVTRATVESVLENANDACFATLLWFLVGGLPAALLHRLTNTLDAMWGYRTERYLHFGRAAARLDDILNWLPARLGALSLAAVGQSRRALRCWRLQARQYDSPNGGVIMAAGAGALGIQLGGAAIYQGKVKARPMLGEGRPARAEDIERSILLFNQALLGWLLALFIFALVW